MDNDIVEEVRARREALFARFGGDLDRLVAEMQRRERMSELEVVPMPKSAPAREVAPTPARAG